MVAMVTLLRFNALLFMMHRFMLGFAGALRFADVERRTAQERQEPSGKMVCVRCRHSDALVAPC